MVLLSRRKGCFSVYTIFPLLLVWRLLGFLRVQLYSLVSVKSILRIRKCIM